MPKPRFRPPAELCPLPALSENPTPKFRDGDRSRSGVQAAFLARVSLPKDICAPLSPRTLTTLALRKYQVEGEGRCFWRSSFHRALFRRVLYRGEKAPADYRPSPRPLRRRAAHSSIVSDTIAAGEMNRPAPALFEKLRRAPAKPASASSSPWRRRPQDADQAASGALGVRHA